MQAHPETPETAQAARQRKAAEAGELLADRIIAAQRKGSRPVRSRERESSHRPGDAVPPPAPPPPPIVLEQPPTPRIHTIRTTNQKDADDSAPRHILRRQAPPDVDFDRSARPKVRGELFVPRGGILQRSSHLHVQQRDEDSASDRSDPAASHARTAPAASRQLFDPFRHDPVRFSSTSPASSATTGGRRKKMRAYTPSITSQSSVTDGSSSIDASSSVPSSSAYGTEASEGPPPAQAPHRSDAAPRANALVETFRRAYRKITELEARRLLEAENEQKGREDKPDDWIRDEVAITALIPEGPTKDDRYWLEAIEKHKDLADAYLTFLELSADPRLPHSLNTLPQKYNIPTRLWQHAFYPMLQRLRRAMPTTSNKDECADIVSHLTEFIYYAYSFYTSLLEEPALNVFRPAWLEQLGDLARYRMLIVGIVVRYRIPTGSDRRALAAERLSQIPQKQKKARGADPDDAQTDTRDSINSLSLDAWDVEEQEVWRTVARDWYAKGIAETPGMGRLHHHIGLLSRSDDFKALYHFTRGLTASHPYLAARESIRPTLEADEERSRRTRPDASPTDLFVQLHGMLFTRIGLDDFDETLDRFNERLRSDFLMLNRAREESSLIPRVSDVKWIMMGIDNIAALLQYGAENSPLKRTMVRKEISLTDATSAARTEAEDVAPQAIMLNPATAATSSKAHSDGSSDAGSDASRLSPPARHIRMLSLNEDETAEPSSTFEHAMRLTFDMLAHCCRHVGPPIAGASSSPNPYLTVLLTFLLQAVQQPATLESLERYIPWTALLDLFRRLPKGSEVRNDPPTKLTGHPLPEDWCMRGMDWTGRHVFSRGYWRQSGAAKTSLSTPPTFESEIDVLNTDYDATIAAQHVHLLASTSDAVTAQRWKRIALAASWFIKCVPGMAYDHTSRHFKIMGVLQSKMLRWAAEHQDARRRTEKDRAAREASLLSTKAEVEQVIEQPIEAIEDNEEHDSDIEEVKRLKCRRRELRRVMKEAEEKAAAQHAPPKGSVKLPLNSPAAFLAGYTILVFDTNILLNAFEIFSTILDSRLWTVILPLAVITELDGLSKSTPEVSKNAKHAVSYLESRVRSHALYLKVQTSRGNYLADLAIRTEAIDFYAHTEHVRGLDDIILRAAAWQNQHFVDRTATFGRSYEADLKGGAAQVALMTFDRNLRIKARTRDVDVVGDNDLAQLVLETQNKTEADKG